jgi:predicted metal-dependent phosphoesterase TrpH
LHCHSTCSDGLLSPADLIAYAKEKGLQGLSITDHDTLMAYPDAFAYAKKQGIQLIPGAEFSTQLKGTSVHILAYSFDFTDKGLSDLALRHQKRRRERNMEILDNLAKEGFLIDPKELPLESSTTVGRPHIAKLLVEKGYVQDMQAAFQLYLGDGRKCYVPGVALTIPETLDAIHNAQGLAVLAHPHLYKNPPLVQKILSFPFDGIECHYARMTPEQNEPWVALAKRRGLLITGGSDFHGAISHGSFKSTIDLGSSSTSWETFNTLLMHFRVHHASLI